MTKSLPTPIITEHDGIFVVRDDLLPGGTKSRYFLDIFEQHDEVVYASPCEGGAQTALAWAAREAGKKCTIFVASRTTPHARAWAAKRLGAQVVQVKNGYLNVVQSKARLYCERTGAYELPFGGAVASAEERIAQAALATKFQPAEVWCAAGSGTLARGLVRAWPKSSFHLVQVGRQVQGPPGMTFTIHEAPMAFGKATKAPCPFPSDPHYDRKAWAICQERRARDGRKVLFWNVAGPAEEIQA